MLGEGFEDAYICTAGRFLIPTLPGDEKPSQMLTFPVLDKQPQMAHCVLGDQTLLMNFGDIRISKNNLLILSVCACVDNFPSMEEEKEKRKSGLKLLSKLYGS